MKKQEFLDDVMHEINILKKHATPRELAKLDFSIFDYDDSEQCIYGQMTGHCGTRRAKKLMDVACIRVFNTNKNILRGTRTLEDETFTTIKQYINGPNKGQGWSNSGVNIDKAAFLSREFTFLSALEGYIYLKGANNEGIIKYLKGEIKTLKL